MAKDIAHLNLVVIGRLEDGVNSLTLGMAQAASQFGDVIAGDYLDSKSLPNRKELFHIQYHTARFECEHINTPLYAENLAKTIPQWDAAILVCDVNRCLDTQKRAVLQLMGGSGLNQIIVLLNGNSEFPDAIDPELVELAELEVQEGLEAIGLPHGNIHIVTGCLDKNADELALRIIDIIDLHFQPRSYDAFAAPHMWIEKVYHVSDKGLKNAPVAFGFLHSGILLRGMQLNILGLTTNELSTRVRSMEIFGKEVERCEAGRSAAVLLERVSKDFPKAGQVLTTRTESLQLADELVLVITPAVDSGPDPLAVVGKYQQFEVYCNMAAATAHLIEISIEDSDPRSSWLRVRVSLDRPMAIFGDDGVVLGTGVEILATGFLAK